MTSRRTIAAVAALGLMALVPLTGAKGAGVEADGNSTTSCSSLSTVACATRTISSDGSRVVFTSEATNLVDGDTNGLTDIFLAVVADGSHTLQRINVPDPAAGGSGSEAGGASGAATISPNGEWVAFESAAANLVGSDGNGAIDIFRYHAPSGHLTRVSVPDGATGLAEGDDDSFAPSVADDGSVAFTSTAGNLVPGGVSVDEAVYVRRSTPAGTLAAAPGADASYRQASISADGTLVAFSSGATNLGGLEDPGHDSDIFVATVGAGTQRVTTDARAEDPSLRPDGLSVAFVADTDADSRDDLVLSTIDGLSTLVVGDCPCDPANDRPTVAPSLVGGNIVAFHSAAPLAAPVTSEQVWVRDGSATVALVSQAPGGPLPNGSSRYISLSGDGSRAVFTSAATNLVADDTNRNVDVFLRQLPGGGLVRLSMRPGSSPGPITPPTTPPTSPPTSTDITPFVAPPVTAALDPPSPASCGPGTGCSTGTATSTASARPECWAAPSTIWATPTPPTSSRHRRATATGWSTVAAGCTATATPPTSATPTG